MNILSLNGRWQLAQAGKKRRLPARVPGCVHTDLLKAKRIPDPFVRDHERQLQWIGETGWTYSRRFTVPSGFLEHDRVLLQCLGLDTLAAISINGRPVGRTDNMFRTWEFDVKSRLRSGSNTITIRFASPVAYIETRQKRRKLPGWSDPLELKGRGWIRKSPCNFGWDWGPVLITSGIWRDIQLAAFDTARLTELQVRQDHSTPKRVVLTVGLGVERIGAGALSARLRVRHEGRLVVETCVSVRGARAEAVLPVPDPQLWWPNGLGAQPLYTVDAELFDPQGRSLDRRAIRVGLRTLRLDRHPDRWGESFQFVVNGVPFFAKGGNWIPADALVTRLTRAAYADLLQSAADAHMNMLRVWGGGIYEDDAFYELCDELGLCVWQDFMFSCSTYPAFDAAFMRNVKAEAGDALRRLRHHPCLALWCGNNELEQGFVADRWGEITMSWKDYAKLFDRLLPRAVQALDPDRDYWPCSPHSPTGDRKDFNNPACGDAHLWSVWHGRQPFEWYRTCEHRFNSEFGFQSFPEPKTVAGFTRPEDRNVTSYVMELHQRCGIGNTVIMQYLLDWFRLPTAFESILFLSQILQGMAMKYAVEHWRRAMPRGMGTLYWQLNDCWPVASWSSIDYHHRWKALHFMARRFYAPLLVSGLEDLSRGTVDVHVTSDRRESVKGRIAWWLTDLNGKPADHGRKDVMIRPLGNTPVLTLDCGKAIARYGARNLLVWLELTVDHAVVSGNLVLFARPKHLELPPPAIRTRVVPGSDASFDVGLEAGKPALWTWLELDGMDARFSDNFFHLRPGTPVRVRVVPARPMTSAAFSKALRVRSLASLGYFGVLAAIDKGLDDIRAGRVIPHEEVKRSLGKWLSTSRCI